MKTPLIFVLTKREQRVVIIIVVALLATAIAKHYFDTRSSEVTSTSETYPSVTPSASP